MFIKGGLTCGEEVVGNSSGHEYCINFLHEHVVKVEIIENTPSQCIDTYKQIKRFKLPSRVLQKNLQYPNYHYEVYYNETYDVHAPQFRVDGI